MTATEEHDRIKDMIQQALEFTNFSADTAEELTEAQMDLVVAGVSAPEYQQFLQKIWKKRREGHGPETDH